MILRIFKEKKSVMKIITLLIISLFLASCGATVTVDYDKNADFTIYNSYNFFPTIDSGLNQLDNARIIQITDSIMQQRGFVKNESPQLFINFYAREHITPSQSTLGFGVGSGGGNVGVGVSGGIPVGGNVLNQRLTFDFIDAKKDALIWQAVAEGEMKERATPQQKEAYYISVIEKILSQYPPKNKE
ncbi:DUF4136 domain-containing protein [Aequorivita sp. SDUM287046]|uniref:DUF4136 domain-containing protein n=1 Tax=Aequorivita aurantiaca TaxID=3053356 RepID=A0ABT8DLC7_9FLAO|nr:DUF4136 domain-containing protein [Aequorivita aurantiaca]MDN3724819.1 DUF4136 domain-containing protein [Aequorivita aurantiaca]